MEITNRNDGQSSEIAVDYDLLYTDSNRLGRVLPAEVWSLAAKRLHKKSPNDFENLANSSLYFRNMLSSQSTTYLFEKVFPVVALSTWNAKGLQGLAVSDVLTCRAVCHKWNDAVDKLIAIKFQHFGEGSENKRLTKIGKIFKSRVGSSSNDFTNYIFNDPQPTESVHNFLRHFERTHKPNGRNPFILAHILVDIYPDYAVNDGDEVENLETFFEGVSTLLSRYGSHIRSFSLKFREHEFLEQRCLREWMLRMPNLMDLNYIDGWNSTVEVVVLDEPNSEYGPCPKLKFLQNVYIEVFLLQVLKQVIPQNNHITKLSIKNADRYDYDIFTFPLPNLKELKMLFSPALIAAKLAFPMVQWPLKTLDIITDRLIDCSTLFQVIQDKFCKTIVSLSITVVKPRKKKGSLCQGCKDFRLDLPFLKSICVSLHVSQVCLDFLLPMRNNLEKITVNCDSIFPSIMTIANTNGSIVQFHGFEGKMLDSNIWAIFKKLKTVQVGKSRKSSEKDSWFYSRKDWMKSNMYN